VIHVCLPDDDLQRLEAVLRDAADAKFRHRGQVVLMAHRGRRHPDIAADIGTPPRGPSGGGSTPTWTAGSTGSAPGRHPGRSPG
jgi:hypothetical protein